MARKARDYKAEYARSKAKAKAAGYSSEREYKAVRKALRLPRAASPVPKRVLERESPGQTQRARERANRIARLRRESKRWSDKHSRVKNSRYQGRWSDDRVQQYHATFVEPREDGPTKKQMLYDYLVDDWDLVDDDEWMQIYAG